MRRRRASAWIRAFPAGALAIGGFGRSRWRLRRTRADHIKRCAGSGCLGARFSQREMVRSETSKPNLKSSPWIRGAPQVGFSATIRNISSRISFEILSLPADLPIFESSRQYQPKLARCHRITVSGLTRMRGCFHADQRRRARSQKILSTAVRLGRGCFRFNTASCCRSTRFSMRRFRRERKERRSRPSQSGNIDGLHSRCEGCGCCASY